MKISFYELLGLINENKPPKEIKYEDDIYTYDEDKNDYVTADFPLGLMNVMNNFDFLKIEIEIIEEKPKKIDELSIKDNCLKDERGHYCSLNKHTKVIAMKLNKVIKALNYLSEKSDKDG